MKKWIPIFAIVILMVTAYFLGIADYFTYEQIQKHHMTLTRYVSENFVLMSFIFILSYLVSTSLSLPIGIYLSLIGGFMFPQPFSTIYVIIGATAGASILFWAARTAFSDFLRKKASPFLSKMEKGFNENAASYLLFLRLVPAFPFWLVNLAPAFLGVNYLTYLWTTALGILPGVVVFTQFGAGLGAVFEGNQEFSIENILNRDIKIALGALAIFVLIPVVIKKLRKK
ncbi:MAG: hypothetical protein K940chlam3_01333 [Chlamydiae bacterium]|nr:hypothetical protein [Chlamydiota bacterium]